MASKWNLTIGAGLLALAFSATAQAQSASEAPAVRLEPSRADSSPPSWPQPAVAPKGAPNILVIMTDDVGFGATAPFGGPVPTPAFAALAQSGVRFSNFHTSALCSPTRAALLTGRNPHEVGFGNVTEMAVGYPGYNSLIPRSAATFARVLRDNGYGTAMFGKHHNVPDWQAGRTGPFTQWPTGLGFDYFYGFFGGATSQWSPALIENTVSREPPHDQPGYILERDLADHAIDWLRAQDNADPARPFLLYYAPLAAHSPHQAPADWIARFKGRFDQGWDRMREETFARQKAAGVIPAGTELTPRPAEIPGWDSLAPESREAAARMMEVYAANLAYADSQIGRMIDEVRRLGRYDNTLVIFIQGDNGGSGEGGVEGTTDQSLAYAGRRQSAQQLHAEIDRMGGPLTENNYPVGWAWAMNAPFRWVKQIAGYRGANTNGMVVSWPGRIADPGSVRRQYGHVIDIAPTLYAAAGIAAPEAVDGVAQLPLAGESLLPVVADPRARPKRSRQYFEIVGNAGIRDGDWEAVTKPRRLPWVPVVSDGKQAIEWELFNVSRDFSQAQDLAASNPAKLSEMLAIFDAEARKRQVYPLDNSLMERALPFNRPYSTHGRSSFGYSGVTTRLGRGEFPRITNRSWTLTADIDLTGDSGVIATQGGRFGGWGLLLAGGRPGFVYKASAQPGDMVRIDSPVALERGRHRLTVDFTYQGPGFGKGGTFALAIDGRKVGEASAARTVPFLIGEAADIGTDTGTPLVEDYRVPFPLQGAIESVRIDLGDDMGRLPGK